MRARQPALKIKYIVFFFFKENQTNINMFLSKEVNVQKCRFFFNQTKVSLYILTKKNVIFVRRNEQVCRLIERKRLPIDIIDHNFRCCPHILIIQPHFFVLHTRAPMHRYMRRFTRAVQGNLVQQAYT